MRKSVLAVATLCLLAGEVAAQDRDGRRPQGGTGTDPAAVQQQQPQQPQQQPPQQQGGRRPPQPGTTIQQPQQPQQAPQVQQQPSGRPQWQGQGGGRAPQYQAPPGPPPQVQQQPRFRPAPPPVVYAPPPPQRQWGGGAGPRGPVYVPQPSYGPPPGSWRHRRPYDWCQVKAQRLHEFEYRMQMDGRVSRDEARIARSLRADLANSCGGGRWNPNRGWYYG